MSAGYRKILGNQPFKNPKEKVKDKQSLFGLIEKTSNTVPGPWTYTIDDGIAKEAGVIDKFVITKKI